jgi:sec-independent protein translocase protein TatC
MADDDANGADGLAEGPEGDRPMSFFEHLTELRKRLVRSAMALAAAVVACYAAVDYLTQLILYPYKVAWNDVQQRCIESTGQACLPDTGPTLQNLTAFEGVLTDIRIAVFAGIFLAAPVLFYHLWMFVSPGLYNKEKRLAIPFVATSAVMFSGGAVFCYMLVLPIATDFLLDYPLQKDLGEGVRIIANYTYQDYVKYTTKLLLGFGIMFQFPLGVFFLAKAGIITHLTLLRHWKVMILSFFVIGALLTPPEPVTQVLMATPMIVLFGLSIVIAYFASKPELERLAQLERELAEFEDDEDDEDDESDEKDEKDA